MALRDVLEVSLGYIQYVVLLLGILPSPFPNFYLAPLKFLKYLYLDFEGLFKSDSDFVRTIVPQAVPVDVRLQFMVISVLLPLLLSMVGLVMLAPKTFLLWYLLLIVGTLLSSVGLLARIADDAPVLRAIGSGNVDMMLGGGIAMVVVLVGIAVAVHIYRSKYVKVEERQQSYEEILNDATRAVDVTGLILHLVYICLLLLAATYLFGAPFPGLPQASTLGPAAVSFAIVILLFAIGLGAWACMGLFKVGRVKRFHAAAFAEAHFLSVLLLLISLLYIPAVSNVVFLVNCNDKTCPRHQRHVDSAGSLPVTTAFSAKEGSTGWWCEECPFADTQTCADEQLGSFCAVSTVESRLVKDASVKCADLYVYLWPACFLVTVGFVIGIPAVYFFLTHKATETLNREFPLDANVAAGLSAEEAFEEKAIVSDNVAAFIYQPFSLRWRHWRMMFIFQKLLLTIAAVFVADFRGLRSSVLSFAAFVVVCLVVLIYSATTQPFIRRLENYLVISTTGMVLLLAFTGFLGDVIGKQLPVGVMIPVAIFVFFVPLISGIVGWRLSSRDEVERRERREQRIEDAIEMAVREDFDAIEDTHLDEEELKAKEALAAAKAKGRRKSSAAVIDTKRVRVRGRRRRDSEAVDANAVATGRLQKGMRVDVRRSKKNKLQWEIDRDRATEEDGATTADTMTEASQEEMSISDFTDRASETDASMSVDTEVGFGEEFGDAASVSNPLAPIPDVPEEESATPILSATPGNPLSGHLPSEKSKADVTNESSSVASQSPVSPTRGNMLAPVGGRRFIGHKPPALLRKEKREAMRGKAPKTTADVEAPSMTDQLLNRQKFNTQLANAARVAKSNEAEVGLYDSPARRKRRNKDEPQLGANGEIQNTPIQSARARLRWIAAIKWAQRKVRVRRVRRMFFGQGEVTARDTGRARLMLFMMQRENKRMAAMNRRTSDVAVDIDYMAQLKDLDDVEFGERVSALYREHVQRIESMQQGVDFRINQLVKSSVQIFFMSLGLLACAAAGCCILGIIRFNNPMLFIPSGRESIPTQSFAQYTSWDEFTKNCCCMQFANVSDSRVYALEKWQCANGWVKERTRAKTSAKIKNSGANLNDLSITSGLSVRGLCESKFTPGCVISGDTVQCNVDGRKWSESLW